MAVFIFWSQATVLEYLFHARSWNRHFSSHNLHTNPLDGWHSHCMVATPKIDADLGVTHRPLGQEPRSCPQLCWDVSPRCGLDTANHSGPLPGYQWPWEQQLIWDKPPALSQPWDKTTRRGSQLGLNYSELRTLKTESLSSYPQTPRAGPQTLSFSGQFVPQSSNSFLSLNMISYSTPAFCVMLF